MKYNHLEMSTILTMQGSDFPTNQQSCICFIFIQMEIYVKCRPVKQHQNNDKSNILL